MTLNANGFVYMAHFWHGNVILPTRPAPGPGTVCTFHTGPCPSRERGAACQRSDATQGVTKYNPSDAYNRAKGRAHALARAMKAAGISRDIRTLIWADYLRKTAKKGR